MKTTLHLKRKLEATADGKTKSYVIGRSAKISKISFQVRQDAVRDTDKKASESRMREIQTGTERDVSIRPGTPA